MYVSIPIFKYIDYFEYVETIGIVDMPDTLFLQSRTYKRALSMHRKIRGARFSGFPDITRQSENPI